MGFTVSGEEVLLTGLRSRASRTEALLPTQQLAERAIAGIIT
jgi:hypothetical protein